MANSQNMCRTFVNHIQNEIVTIGLSNLRDREISIYNVTSEYIQNNVAHPVHNCRFDFFYCDETNHWNLYGFSDDYDEVTPFFAKHWTNDNIVFNINDLPVMINTDNTYIS